MTFNPKKFLEKPPSNLAGWVRELTIEDLPVLQRTAFELEDLREFEEQVEVQLLEELVSGDPLMTAKLFGFIAKRRGKDVDSEADNVRQAVLLLGTSLFFKSLGTNQAAEDMLSGQPDALEGFLETLEKARRAGRFAAAFAAQRDDPDTPLLRDTALLHHLPELVVWLRAPSLALEVLRRARSDATIHLDDLSKVVLNASYTELRLELLKAWRLPRHVAQLITGQAGPDSAQVHTLHLALRASEPAHANWESSELGELVREIGTFLQLGLQPTWNLLKNVKKFDE